jgi:hypothetical protein
LKKRNKTLLVVLLVMILLVSFGTVFAYWGGLINGSSANDNETIEIGEGSFRLRLAAQL